MIPNWLFIQNNVALVIFVVGTFVFSAWAIIFWAYWKCESREPRHIMMSLACWILCFHQAVLATLNSTIFFSVTDAVILSRLALTLLVALSGYGLIGHFRVRRQIRNE